MTSVSTWFRRLAVLALLGGIVHLLVPERLLAAAEWGYDRVLAVDFTPRPAASRRVRLVGVLMLGGAALVIRLLERQPSR
jgi:hypothetical protein